MLTKLKTLLNKFFSKVEDYSDDFWPDSSSMDWADTEYDFWIVPEKEVKLSQAQIQYLIDLNKKALTNHFAWLSLAKSNAKEDWELSNKDTPEGRINFAFLNRSRDMVRYRKTEIKKLSEIQAVLKKLRSQA